jgi:hypothetical protein
VVFSPESVQDLQCIILDTVVGIAQSSFSVWFEFTEQRDGPVEIDDLVLGELNVKVQNIQVEKLWLGVGLNQDRTEATRNRGPFE